jgi:hypothetical protein
MTRFETSRTAWILSALFFLVLIGIEASCLLPDTGALRAGAAWSWITCSGLVLSSALIYSLLPFFLRGFWASPDFGWYLAAFFAPVVLVLFGLDGYAHTQINDEGVQQVVCGLDLISSRRDLGLFSFGFLGYPARQYLLAAMPSLLLGRSLITLRIGFGGLYLLGYVTFLSATWRYLEARKSVRPMLLASLSGVLVALGSYPLLYARLFEQTIVPLSATLLFLAGLLLFLSRPGPLSSMGFIWALGFMPYSYTPSLSAWGFGMAVLAFLAFSGLPGQRALFAAALAYGALTFAVSSIAQVHANLLPSRLSIGVYSSGSAAGFSDGSAGAWASRFLNGLHATIGIEESLVPAPLALGILFILIHSLRRRDYRVLWLCLWAAATVVLALALKGYWQRVPEIDVHRAMIILPPLSLALAMYVAANRDGSLAEKHERVLRGLLISGILFMLLNSAYLPLIRRVPRAYFPFGVTDKEEASMLIVKGAARDAKVVYLVPPLYFPLEDTLAYLSPGTQVVRGYPPSGEHQKGNYVISYIGKDPYVNEDPYARSADHPVRYSHSGPYLGISPE